MKIEEGNANKTIRINKRFSVIIVVTLVIFMINGSTATMSYAAPQTLPSCTDPTGQNLRCMMVISTLPPPPNALQCQETSGQILPCSYATQILSNGEQIIAITVYVPISYLFTGYGSWTVAKQVVHETKTMTKTKLVYVQPPPQGIPPPPTTCDSKYYTGPCPPTDPNAYTKCISAALLANDINGELACARLLPDTPENAYTKCISEALIKKDLRAELECAKLLPNASGAAHNTTNTTTAASPAPSNTSAAIPPNNTSIPSSGKPGTGSTCVNNCTTGTPPPVDCTKNPTDPSCTQTLTPSTTTPPPSTSPTTKTCPDGSVIDASATCPTPSTIPNTPPPPSSSTPPPPSPSNNPSPPGTSNNGGGGSGSGNGGSSTPQPSTLS